MAARTITNLGQDVALLITGVSLVIESIVRNADGTLFDLTGCTLSSQIKSSTGSVLATLVPTILDADRGRFTLELSASNAAAITARSGVWDVILTDASGRRFQLAKGPVTIEPKVSA